MSITFSPEQEQLIQVLLATDRFNSVDSEQEWFEETRIKIHEGIASLERRERIDGETFVNQLLTQLKQAKEA
ncbi:type II toxin-antitoxin system ParD family antitoxin [Nostoc sp.]|uniref:type II toxin-antitoxin system ParD family antitoxin n=1 Tax=Nostoc sp. TaxID=1180 RepID=UPI002FF6EB8D